MTLTSAAIAGPPGHGRGGLRSRLWVPAAAGLVVAHMANNLMNDLFDLEVGTDTADYPRALYAPHPVLSGLISRRGLARAALVLNVVDAGVLATLVATRGWVVAAFADAGFGAPPADRKCPGYAERSLFSLAVEGEQA